MNGKEFVDTNVLIYAFDRTAGKKWETAGPCGAPLVGARRMRQLAGFAGVLRNRNQEAATPSGEALAHVEGLGKWTPTVR